MFLTIQDYHSVCDTFELETLQADTNIRLQAELSAQELISSYLRSRYDIQKAFLAQGNQRNPQLVQCTVNIALYLMVHRLPQNMGHERRQCLYDDAIRWLKDVQSSKASPDLPLYTAPDGTTDAHNPIRYGSQPKTNTSW